MVNRNIKMKKKNNDEWENIFPLSLNENIYNTDGKNLNDQFDDLTNNISNEFLEHEKNINEFKNDINNSLDIFNSELEDVKIRVSNIRSISAYDVDPTGQKDSL